VEPEIIKEQRKLREVEKLYLHPEDTYNRYLQNTTENMILLQRILL